MHQTSNLNAIIFKLSLKLRLDSMNMFAYPEASHLVLALRVRSKDREWKERKKASVKMRKKVLSFLASLLYNIN